MQPVLGLYAGYSLKGERVAAGSALAPFVQDSLNEIEYVTGDPTTPWGARRVHDGHAAPFALNYVEIGNEDSSDEAGTYDARYAQFYQAIKRRFPTLQLIATTPVRDTPMDLLDEHFYNSAQEFFEDVHHYDMASRNGPKIFVGEWATREGVPTPDFGAALGDAAWMTGMERNSDLVVLSSYAPLFTNVNAGALQWETNLIGYDSAHSYASPSYYAQALFARFHGDEILATKSTGSPVRFFSSVMRSQPSSSLFVKLINANTTAINVSLRRSDGSQDGAMNASGRLFRLTAPSVEATNSINDPERITPQESRIELSGASSFTLPPLSINVLVLDLVKDPIAGCP